MSPLHRVACCLPRDQFTQHATRSPHLLLIAYGNTLRRDDGAGLALAEQLMPLLHGQGLQVDLIAVQQLTPELALEMADSTLDAICFFDTAVEPRSTAIQIHPVGATQSAPVLGHHLIPSTLLLYAARLYHRCPPTWLVTIPGSDFELGEGFSPATARHLTNLEPLAKKLGQLAMCAAHGNV